MRATDIITAAEYRFVAGFLPCYYALSPFGVTIGVPRLAISSGEIVDTKRHGRSRVSNGTSTFLEGVDGRSQLARRYRDILGDLVSDLGGPEHTSTAQLAIARRAATLCVWCERAEADMAGGEDIDVGEYTTVSNAMRRLLCDLGLERRARDVTPSLTAYMAQKAAEKVAAAKAGE